VKGTVYLVGAGPGAADLLTVRAARLLGEAEVVFYDALVPHEILSLIRTIHKIPVGKRCGKHSTAQRFINKRLLDAARRHRVVVRLKGGDPMLFGRAQEEIDFLTKHGVEVEVVPGITAALAASADLQISLTRRGSARTVSFVTPRVGEGEHASRWVDAVLAADTAAIYMGAGDAAAIAAALIAAGKPASTPVAIMENASLPSRLIGFETLERLGQITEVARGGPTLILLGEAFKRPEASFEIPSYSPDSPVRIYPDRGRLTAISGH
jgi:uroporphyrin-III C-methyltransferase